MLFFVYNAQHPIDFVSCGNLVSQTNFLHPRRTLDTYVLISVQKGTLYINQNGKNYQIGPNQFILLFSNSEHYGYKASSDVLSYYWVHFNVRNSIVKHSSQSSLERFINIWNSNPKSNSIREHYILPEHGQTSFENRSNLLFVQLLDISKSDFYTVTYRSNYALSLLLLEISHEAINPVYFKNSMAAPIVSIIEWIRANFDKTLSVKGISDQFNYNPTYLSSQFKKYTGYSLLSYVNYTKITVSKNLLINRQYPIAQISHMCGFSDEKYFMKLFKKVEGLTPTEYRNTFFCKKINTN